MSIETKRACLTALEKIHGRRLRRFFAGRLQQGCRSAAPDLVQEVFLRLLRVEDHEVIRNPQAYLYTIANHVLHQHALRNAADGPQFVDVITQLNADEAADPQTELEIEQRVETLARALQEHSPRAYATLVWHRCDGIPLKEIAPRLGVSYTMVKRYLAQALAFCQPRLQEKE